MRQNKVMKKLLKKYYFNILRNVKLENYESKQLGMHEC